MFAAMEILIHQLNELPAVAKQIILFMGDRRVLLFYGAMGAGKTTLINELCHQLHVLDAPASPTFSIVNEYGSTNGLIYHFDFYRLKDEQEAFDLGYEEYFFSGNYCFVEWPEKIPNLIPENAVEIRLSLLPSTERLLLISSL